MSKPESLDARPRGVDLIREVLAFASFKGAPGTEASEALDALIAERDRLRAAVEHARGWFKDDEQVGMADVMGEALDG